MILIRLQELRLNDTKNLEGIKFDINKPYAIKIVSDVEIIVQYSRLTSYGGKFSLMTKMGYST